jgi:TonB family protein
MDQDASLRRGLSWSGLAHGVLLMLVAALCLFWPKPVVTVVPDMTFTLVKNPSKTLPPKTDAKGDKPQLAGGKQRQLQRAAPKAAVKPVSIHPPAAAKAKSFIKSSLVTPKKTMIPIAAKPADPLLQAQNQPQVLPNSSPAESSPGAEPTEQLAVSPDKMAPYFDDLKKNLSSRWFPPRGESSLRVVTQFVIQADGQITDIQIKESSGDPATDEAARQALEASSPLTPLPTDWGVSNVPILFSFDYTVFGKSRAKKTGTS